MNWDLIWAFVVVIGIWVVIIAMILTWMLSGFIDTIKREERKAVAPLHKAANDSIKNITKR